LAARIDDIDIRDLDEAIAHAARDLRALAGARLFVTGGTGFIGRWLLAVLARAHATMNLGLAVTVLTRSRAAFARRSPQLAADPMVRFVEGDVRSFAFPEGGVSHVIHAATDTSTEADRDPLLLIDTIVNGTRRVLDFSRAAGARRVLLLSSGAVYGSPPREIAAVPEDYAGACATTERKSVYGQGKRVAEQLGTIFHTEFALDVVIGRLFAFVGPGMPLDAHFAIGNFIRDAFAGREIVVKSDGSPVRSYLYAGDLAAWLIRLLVAGRAGAAYNVGSDAAMSLADLAALVARVVPGANGHSIKGAPNPNAFHSRYVPAIGRAREELGLDVWTPLDQGIRRTAAWAAGRDAGVAQQS
jgi:nucleoside-diphosphate-sugar epimerase